MSEEMKAKQMFEKLGWKQEVDSDNFLQYATEFETRYAWDRLHVVFNKKTKKWFVGHNYKLNGGELVRQDYTKWYETPQNYTDTEVKNAINKQIEELRWY